MQVAGQRKTLQLLQFILFGSIAAAEVCDATEGE
jgi:hypothetical protein